MKLQESIETQRLILRPFQYQDGEELFAFASDPENTRWMVFLPVETLEETRRFIEKAEAEWKKEESSYYEYAILLKGEEREKVIGEISLWQEETGGELGWILHKEYWNRGFVTEAAKGLLEAIRKAGICQKIIAHCDEENIPSRRVMEKLGMKRTGRSFGRKNRLSEEERWELCYEMPLVSISMPAAAAGIISRLQSAGFEAYIVGGCVRDSLLGRTPGDWDITTSALPEQVKGLFRRTIDTGIQHGTVTVMDRNEGYEITTYRLDGEYADGRHPLSVAFTRSLEEDLKRRDFTINAMAYNDKEGLVDLFGGIHDLKQKIIRSVGQAEERFGEDALRIMRAVRFSAQLGFSIEKGTLEAAKRLAPTLCKISKERIQTELNKLLISDHPEYFKTMYEAGITKEVMPEFDALMEMPQKTIYHYLNIGEHTLEAVKAAPKDLTLRLTMLLHDVGKAWTMTVDEKGVTHFKGHADKSAVWAGTFLRGLKYDNHTIDKVVRLIRYHDYRFPAEKKAVRKAMNQVGPDLFPELLQVMEADTMAKSEYAKADTLPRLEAIRRISQEILEEGQCVTLKQLAVKGGDLIREGFQPGPGMGEILEKLLQIVLEEPEKNERELLLTLARQMAKGIEEEI